MISLIWQKIASFQIRNALCAIRTFRMGTKLADWKFFLPGRDLCPTELKAVIASQPLWRSSEGPGSIIFLKQIFEHLALFFDLAPNPLQHIFAPQQVLTPPGEHFQAGMLHDIDDAAAGQFKFTKHFR